MYKGQELCVYEITCHFSDDTLDDALISTYEGTFVPETAFVQYGSIVTYDCGEYSSFLVQPKNATHEQVVAETQDFYCDAAWSEGAVSTPDIMTCVCKSRYLYEFL